MVKIQTSVKINGKTLTFWPVSWNYISDYCLFHLFLLNLTQSYLRLSVSITTIAFISRLKSPKYFKDHRCVFFLIFLFFIFPDIVFVSVFFRKARIKRKRKIGVNQRSSSFAAASPLSDIEIPNGTLRQVSNNHEHRNAHWLTLVGEWWSRAQERLVAHLDGWVMITGTGMPIGSLGWVSNDHRHRNT